MRGATRFGDYGDRGFGGFISGDWGFEGRDGDFKSIGDGDFSHFFLGIGDLGSGMGIL